MQFSKKRMAELEIIGTPQHRMWCKLFVLLHSSDGVCLSVQGLVARIIEALAYHIEERFDAFLQSRMGPPSADDIKRRRLDPHMENQIIKESIDGVTVETPRQLRRSLKVAGVAKSVYWSEQTLCALQAGNHMSFHTSTVLSFTMDAAAIGKPYKDYLLITKADCIPSRNTVCPK